MEGTSVIKILYQPESEGTHGLQDVVVTGNTR